MGRAECEEGEGCRCAAGKAGTADRFFHGVSSLKGALSCRMGAGLTIRMLCPTDSPLLGRVAPGVFDNEVEPRWTAEFLADPRHHMAVALIGGQVVGMASAVHYVHPDKPPELWVNEVGVAPTYQGQGIGRLLLEALFARGRALGCSEAWLGTEETNIVARRLYAAVGGEEQPMVHVSFRLATPK
jgi:GNAT superfamily N-acetyltransferase